MPLSPLTHLSPHGRRFLNVAGVVLLALFVYGCGASLVALVIHGSDAEVYFPRRGSDPHVPAAIGALLYALLIGFTAWGLYRLKLSALPRARRRP